MKNILIIPILFCCLSAISQQRVQCGTKDSFYIIPKVRYDTVTIVQTRIDSIRVDTTVPVWCDSVVAIKNPAVFPLNEYLRASVTNPYPIVNLAKLREIDTTKLTSVLAHGAKGDGKTFDDAAVVAAFKAAPYGVIFPAGRTYLLSKFNRVILNKNIIVWAYGATIKMADFTRYSVLEIQYQPGEHRNQVIWLGGTLDGNREKQSYPGSPSGQTAWKEAHGRFLGISYSEFALVKDVTLVNIVMDGIGIEACKLGVISDCKASNGAPFKYSQVQEQGTYFKFTRVNMKTCYFNNLISEGGSIGVHVSYPTKSEMDTAILAVINNCKFNNQAQNAVHIEDAYKFFMYKSTVRADTTYGLYNPSVHISNRTAIASIKNCDFTNGRLNFNNASSLKIGVVDSCNFVCTFRGNSTSIQSTFIRSATHIINSTFKGKVSGTEQAWARYTRKSTFTDFGDKKALRAGRGVVEGCTFINGAIPVQLSSESGLLMNCTFINVTSPNKNMIPPNDSWKNNFRDYISLLDDKGRWLGNIKLGL